MQAAVALAAVPGRRKKTLELGREIERRGFAGIYCASFGDGLGLCLALAQATERIALGTAIVNLYMRNPFDYAQTASLVHELSGGRFRFGVGISHESMNKRLGLATGKPLVLAGLRKRMVALAGEVADGVVFANVARSHLAASLEALPAAKRADPGFFVGNMIPVCISDDRAAAAAVSRKTLAFYLTLPNYRNVWKEAGYAEEMDAVEKALARGERERIAEIPGERWLSDCTLYGSAREVREGVEAWLAAGVRTPILVPSSAQGGQFEAFAELFAALA